MNSFKNYHNVHEQNNDSSIRVSKMEAIYASREGAVDEPHRHDYYTILLIEKAKGIHKIDFNSYELADRQVYFVAPGQVHQIIEETQSFGYAIIFTTQFLIENAIPLSFIDSLNLFQNYGQSPPLLPSPAAYQKLSSFMLEMHSMYQGNIHLKDQYMGAYLKLLLLECNTICAMNPLESDSNLSGNHLIRAFKKYVDEEYKTEHASSFYADKLNITPDHLNRLIKAALGKTAKEYIQARIITEAKRLLYFTPKTNKEIAYELGFSEPANFSAFFKKCTQIAPSEFKKKEFAR